MKKNFCEKCNKIIKVGEIPWCLECRKKMLEKAKVAENKSFTKISDEQIKKGEEDDEKEEAEEILENLPFDEEEEIL